MNSDYNGKIRITILVEENGDFILNFLYNSSVFDPFLNPNKTKANDIVDIIEISVNILRGKTRRYFHRQYYGFNSLYVQI